MGVKYRESADGSWREIMALKGDTGPAGPQGEAGYTPIRGTDYWTAADQASIVNDVLTALPAWNGGSY